MRLTIGIIAYLILYTSCIEIKNEVSGLPPGSWRGELLLSQNPYPVYDEDAVRDRRVAVFDGIDAGKLPFLFEVSYPTPDSFVIDIINGKERIRITDYKYGLDRSTSYDTIRISFPEYNSYIHAEFKEEVLQGEFVDRNRKGYYSIPFVAYHGESERFSRPIDERGPISMHGVWDVTFSDESGSWPAIGEFQQQEEYLTGTFLTETGDYRFLSGVVHGKEIWLSTFDGTHAFLFQAKKDSTGQLSGSFRSGTHYSCSWSATPNPNATLTNPDSLTQLVDREKLGAVKGIHTDSKDTLALKDVLSGNEIIILSVMGTWCPNCKDEALFLKEWLSSHPDVPVRVIGLAFEKVSPENKAIERIQAYKKSLGLPYEIWYMGTSSKKQASQKLPFLSDVSSYPTMVIISPKAKVERIHTGFAGPATSAYTQFTLSFDQTISDILAQSH